MSDVIYEQIYDLDKTGISIHYRTSHGNYTPPHWHPALELHYILNGIGEMNFEGKKRTLVEGEVLLVDSNVVHHAQCSHITMELYIHISRDFLKKYVPDIELYHLECDRESLQKEQLKYYLRICELLKELPRAYITQEKGYEMHCESVVMEILYILVNHFSRAITKQENPQDVRVIERLNEIAEYVKLHYKEPASVDEIAAHFGLSKEYFCRFFKKHMGVTYTRHINLIRLVHIYEDILSTQDNIHEITDRHGFTNYKLFRKLFREIYDCQPSQLRKR